MKLFVLFLLTVSSFAHEFSGEVVMENRLYFQEGLYGNEDQSEQNLVIKPEYIHSWDDDRKVVNIIPYIRLSDPDGEKNLVDLREASIVASWENLELRAGVSKVFWGVTEGVHLIDIINQTSLVESPDGEDKLGQPMINPTFVTDYGLIDYFFLPYFRERTFSGREGRYRTALEIDQERATYQHKDKETHLDHALRYSHTWDDLDYGLSYFRGTDREPVTTFSGTRIIPHYIQAEQFGVDLQYILGEWLLKFEGIYKKRETQVNYFSTAGGFEYTFSNIWGGYDIGVLYEHYYDERLELEGALFKNHSFLGSRVAFNDEMSTEFLFGGIIDNEEGRLQSLRLESSRRINENWKWDFEVNTIIDTEKANLLYQFREDDYAQLSLSYFW